MTELDGKVAIVTGAASGLGKVTAEVLAADGAAVLVADVNRDNAETVVKELVARGHRAVGFGVDVALEDQVRDMVAAAVKAFDRVDAAGCTDREVLAYVGSLLSRWADRDAECVPVQPVGAIGDALTARERLARISQGLPNKWIARALEISPETVKSRIKHIFVKLAVGSRTEAALRGKSLGLS